MTKLRTVGSAWDILDRAVHEGGGAKAIAAFENVTKFAIYDHLDPDKAMLGHWTFDRVLRLAREFPGFAGVLAGAFAILARGRGAPVRGEVEGLLRAARESAEALAAGWAALEDGRVTRAEQARLRREIHDAITAFIALDDWLAGEGGE